jgi:hypothetical protein
MFPGQNLISQMLPASRDIRAFQQQMGGGGYSGVSSNPGWDALSNQEKADFYGQNPTMAGITQLGQKAFGLSSYGMLQNALQPAFVSEQKAVAQGPMALSGFTNFGKESAIPSGGMVSPGMSGDFSPETGLQGGGSGSTGLYGDAAAGMSTFGDAAVGAGGGFGGGVGTGDFGGSPESASDMGYAQGGRVQLKDLIQPAPGPDDGYGGLQDGEYVIKKDAVKKYGIKMLENINQRKVSKKQVSNFFKNHG